jgi:hypothetical protein
MVCLACRAAKHPDFESLSSAGILPCSSKNPYLGSNLLIAREVEDSSFLYHFLKERGAPKAIKVSSNGYQINLYYPREQEYYRASFNDLEWVIKGPYPIPRSEYREVTGYQTNDPGEVVLHLWGRNLQFTTPLRKVPHDLMEFQFPTPTPRPRPKPRVIVPTAVPTPSGPLTLDQEALRKINQRTTAQTPAAPAK